MRRRIVQFLTLVLLLVHILPAGAVHGQSVYKIPIKGDITNVTASFVKDSLSINHSYDAVLFEIDTYGGRIDSAVDIKNLILQISVPTIAYVNDKAESAGVLVALANEKVYMANSSTIGSAQPIPNNEKVLSMWRGMLRDVSQVRARDERIVMGMADLAYGMEGRSGDLELINLTAKEAMELGIADGIANGQDEVLAEAGFASASVTEAVPHSRIRVANFLTQPWVGTLLLIIAMVGFVIELFTPGFGVGGAVAILGFGLYFAGGILSGDSQWVSVVLFLLGLVMLGVELMVPGFGLPGISGILLVMAGIVLASGDVIGGLFSLSVAFLIAMGVAVFMVKRGFKSALFQKIVLQTNLTEKRGFSSSTSKEGLLGKTGVALTILRPTGVVDIDDNRVDVLTLGEFIDKGVQVQVVKVEGSKVFVEVLKMEE